MHVEIYAVSSSYGAVSINCKEPIADNRHSWTVHIALQYQACNLYLKLKNKAFTLK